MFETGHGEACSVNGVSYKIKNLRGKGKGATNFVVHDGELYYIDYECNDYMEEWDFENWGIKYWSKTPEFMEYCLELKPLRHT